MTDRCSTPLQRLTDDLRHAVMTMDDARAPYTMTMRREQWMLIYDTLQTVARSEIGASIDTLDWNRLRSGDRRALNPDNQPLFDQFYATQSANTSIDELASFMVELDADVDICYPGNHGGPEDKWLVTVTRLAAVQDENTITEYLGATLEEAIKNAADRKIDHGGR